MADKYAEDDRALFFEELRSGSQTLGHESAEQDSGYVVAGNPQRKERDECRSVHRVVRGFRSGDAFHLAFAERFGMTRGVLGRRIAHHRGNDLTKARHDTDGCADQRRTPDCRDAAPKLLSRQAMADKPCEFLCPLAAHDRIDQFGKGEDADEHRQ